MKIEDFAMWYFIFGILTTILNGAIRKFQI